jgi:hypothetical protein
MEMEKMTKRGKAKTKKYNNREGEKMKQTENKAE